MRNIPTIELHGEVFVTEAIAAKVLKRSVKTVSRYITVGNCLARLPALDIAGKRLIKVSDLKSFPLTGHGSRARFNVMHLNDNMTQLVRCAQCSIGQPCGNRQNNQ
jgi:hypothetical protein